MRRPGRTGPSRGGREIGPCTTDGCTGTRRVAFTDHRPIVVCSNCRTTSPPDWLAIQAELMERSAS